MPVNVFKNRRPCDKITFNNWAILDTHCQIVSSKPMLAFYISGARKKCMQHRLFAVSSMPKTFIESDGTTESEMMRYFSGPVWLHCLISYPVDACRYLGMWLDLTMTHWQTWLFSSTSTYHSTDLLTARGVAHLVVHGTSGSTSYETIPPVRLETSGDVLSTVDMVVQRRDGPRRLRDDDDDDDDDDRHWDSDTDPEQSVGAVVVMSAGRWYSPVSYTDAVSLSTVVDA